MTAEKCVSKISALAHPDALAVGSLTIAKLLRTTGETEGATQDEFALLLGIPKQHLCSVENACNTFLATSSAQFALPLSQPPTSFIQSALEEEFRQLGLMLRKVVEAAHC